MKGKHYKLLTQVLAQHNYQLVFIEQPYQRCIQQLKLGRVDFALYIEKSDDINLINYQLASWDLVFVYAKGSTWRFDQKQDNSQHKVMISKDYHYPKPILTMLEDSNVTVIRESFYVHSVNEVKRLFKLLNSGFVDALVVDKAWVEFEMSRLSVELEVDDQVLHSHPGFIGYHQRNHLLAREIEQILVNRIPQNKR